MNFNKLVLMLLDGTLVASVKLKQFSLFVLLSIFASFSHAETGLLTDSGIASSYQSIDNGNKIIYTFSREIFMPIDLLVKEVRGDREIKLSNELGPQGRVAFYRVSPDESMVVYAGSRSDGGLVELYSVSLSGGASTPLNVSLNGATERIGSYSITPDNQRVVYSVIRDGIFKTLYVVPISGGASLKLGVESEVISLGEITSDSKFMIFVVLGLSDANYSERVYKADLSNGVITQLSHDSLGNGTPDLPILTDDGQHVVYDHFSDVAAENGLYVVSVSNGNPIRITPPLVAGGFAEHKEFSPDNLFVYYVADQEVDNQRRLYRVPLLGGPSEEIISNFSSGESITNNGSMRINSTGTHAVFEVEKGMGFNDLYSANLTTGIAAKLNLAGRVLGFRLSNDGSRVVFNADSETQELFELFSTPIAGGPPVKLNADYSNTQNTTSGINYDISPDSGRVAYWVDLDGDFKNEIFEVPITGDASTQLSPILTGDSDVGFPEYSLDGSLVLFDISVFEGVELGIYAFDFKEPESDESDEFCFPILTANQRTALVCL